MTHDLEKATSMPIRSMDDLARLADMFAKSGYFTDAKDAAQIGVKVLAGREMGFGPFASVNGVHVIQGKPTVGSNLMAAAVKAHPKYDFRVTHLDDEQCSIEFRQEGEPIGVSTFDLEDAKAAGTKNLQKFARNMLFARAMSNGVRWYCPDVFMGATVYTPEELGSDVPPDDVEVAFVEPKEATQATAIVEADDTPEVESEADNGAPVAPHGIGEERATKLMQALTNHGVKDLYGFLRVQVDRDVETFADLTEGEGRELIEAAKEVPA